MPVSYDENWIYFKQWLLVNKPETFFDIGMGYGNVGRFIKNILPNSEVNGVEVFLPYLYHERSNVKFYDRVIISDVRKLINKLWAVDVVTAFDVIEHMPREDGLKMIEFFRGIARTAVIVNVPIVHYEQGALEGNEFERHLDQWKSEEMIALGGRPLNLGKVTGMFIFENNQQWDRR